MPMLEILSASSSPIGTHNNSHLRQLVRNRSLKQCFLCGETCVGLQCMWTPKMNLNYAQKKNPFKSQMVMGLACSEGLVYNMCAVELNGCQTCQQLCERYSGPCLNAPHNITEWHLVACKT